MFIRFAFSRRINFEAEDTGMVQVVETKKFFDISQRRTVVLFQIISDKPVNYKKYFASPRSTTQNMDTVKFRQSRIIRIAEL